MTTADSPAIAYEYIWFGGQPVAQVTTSTGEVSWYFNDHLGTPVLQTGASANVVWRVEREPYGATYVTRVGAERHQPLSFPGQEETVEGEIAYNVFRWYRSAWSRYSQADPLAKVSPPLFHRQPLPHMYGYAADNPLLFIDRFGLATSCCDCPEGIWSYSGFSGGAGALIGLTYGKGTFTCKSKPSLKVNVQTTCFQFGLFANLGGGWDTSAVPLGIVAAKACKKSELTDPDAADGAFGGGKLGLGISGNPGKAPER